MNKELLQDMVKCAKRECAMRERVYPYHIMKGKMTDAQAAREKYLMEQILALLQAILYNEHPELNKKIEQMKLLEV